MINKTFKINDIINIKNAVLLAPMEGITNLPFRILCRELGADIVYTEFTASEALVRNIDKSLRKLKLSPKEHPVAIQIFGSNPNAMAESAKIAQDKGADFVDINYGCWVKKIVSNNAGSALMKNPLLMAEITNKCVNSVSIPVTVKTRLGWDKKNINIFEIAELQEQAGAKAITVHCRTRDMKISGNADWSYIPEIKKHITIPLVLNGDINTPEKAYQALQTEGAGAIMIGRAAVGNPFIFRNAKYMIEHGTPPEPVTIRERLDICLKHLSLCIEYQGQHGIYEFRKHYSGYLKGIHNASNVRQKLVIAETFDEIKDLIERFYEETQIYYNNYNNLN